MGPVRLLLLLIVSIHVIDGLAGAAAAGEEPGPSIRVRVDEQSLVVDVREAPLADVLRAIGARVDVDVTVRGDLDTTVTRSFVASSLEDAVRQLARGHSTVWIYEPSSRAPRHQKVAGLVVVAASNATRTQAIRAEERATRLQDLRRLVVRRDAPAQADLARLADDPDPVIRAQALRGLRRIQGDNATPRLAAALLRDTDPTVRRTAAQLLAGARRAEARETLERAAHDPDRSVRRAAAAALLPWRHRAR
jgi:hypothetical protein